MKITQIPGSQVRAVCESCGRRSRWLPADDTGRVPMWEIARGWSCAPYAPSFVHPDGTHGDRWICPRCAQLPGYTVLGIECTEVRS